MDANVERNAGFNQVCVWPGIIVGKENVEEFVKFFEDEMKTRVQYLEEVKTLPDRDEHGNQVLGTGDRNDVFFAVHEDDVGKFAVPRLSMGIRWIEDAIGEWNNPNGFIIYPHRVKEYRTW